MGGGWIGERLWSGEGWIIQLKTQMVMMRYGNEGESRESKVSGASSQLCEGEEGIKPLKL